MGKSNSVVNPFNLTLISRIFPLVAIGLLLTLFSKGQSAPSFMNMPVDLSNNEVTSIIQDKNGFLWLGTRGGLQWFDGYDIRLLKTEPGRGTNLLSQSIEVLANGKDSSIWIGTKSGGLSHYDFLTGRLVNIRPQRQVDGFNSDYILSLMDTDSEKLFIGTWKGFQYYDKRRNRFHILNTIWKTFDIQSDGNGGLWLATNNGLVHLDARLRLTKRFDFGIPGINISSLVVDHQEQCLWLGSWQRGVIRFSLKDSSARFYQHKIGDSTSISSNNAYRVFMDSQRRLWVGTWGGGLNRLNPRTGWFEKVRLSTPGIVTGDNQIILTIQEDPSGLLWVGTDGLGVFKADLHQKTFRNITYSDRSALSDGTRVIGVYRDPFEKLWLGIRGEGINYADKQGRFRSLQLPTPDVDVSPGQTYDSRSFLQGGNFLWIGTNKGLVRIPNTSAGLGRAALFQPGSDKGSISGRKVSALAFDSSGNLWVGQQEHGLSRVIRFRENGVPVFQNYFPAYGEKGALQNERVSCLYVDSRKRLWVGTYKGLHLYVPESDQFRYFAQNENGGGGLSNNTILCLTEDNKGHIWAGTQFGLNRIDSISKEGLVVQTYTRKNGLPSDYIDGVIADKRGFIWVSTNKGLARLDPSIGRAVFFDKRDGVQSPSFTENATFYSPDGYMYFGGLAGVTLFHPDSIRINSFRPPIFFTRLNINNVPYESGHLGSEGDEWQKPFYEVSRIELEHTQNILTIGFAALDYHAPDKNEYMYLLEGFNKEWITADNSRTVTFTNLQPGSYRLLVKATNSDKIWSSDVHELSIKVLPPPWKTWWAYSLYIGLFILLLWLTRHLGLRQEALRNQLMLSKLEQERGLQLSQYKERLFTNISHEFRTPLTLILGPLEDLLQRRKADPAIRKSLRLIQKQSRRMLRMVNQLLDVQKAESGTLRLHAQPRELITFCRDIFSLFEDEANRRKMDYRFESAEPYLSFSFDADKLEIIVFNLLSNAFKFTPNGGFIKLDLGEREEQGVRIRVTDTGRGVPLEEQQRIFERFYRGDSDDVTRISGTGIGLSFVKELVSLHGGTISVESDGTKGSIFIVDLPLIRPTGGLERQALNPVLVESITKPPTDMEQEQADVQPELPIVLVVEDEPDMMEYIVEILSPSFQVVTATNGQEGLEKALEVIPDLIISDVMMPVMDGLELCRRLKADKGTSHIPVVLLTALNDITHHVQGIREGADVYLPKPFHSQLLLVHIHNLIQSRNMLKDLYAKKIFLGAGNFEIKSFEEEFLNKLMKHVEEHLSDSNFSMDELATLMYMSKSTFYRKLRAVTGMSGNEFIRTSRLNYAARLLQSGNYSVSDAAFEAGFNDLKYFRKRFQEQFGVSPSSYKK